MVFCLSVCLSASLSLFPSSSLPLPVCLSACYSLPLFVSFCHPLPLPPPSLCVGACKRACMRASKLGFVRKIPIRSRVTSKGICRQNHILTSVYWCVLQLTDDETERRRKRRENNKLAAQKCRAKRSERAEALERVSTSDVIRTYKHIMKTQSSAKSSTCLQTS